MAKICLNFFQSDLDRHQYLSVHSTGPSQIQMSQVRKFWSREEDEALIQIVRNMSPLNWTLASVQLYNVSADFNRNSKQCRERWIHKLNNKSDQGEWSVEEERIMVDLFIANHNGKNKWKFISENLLKRTANLRNPTQIKNRFYAMIRRGLRRINNLLGKKVRPQQIRILKPKTISSFIEEKDNEISQKLVQVIFMMASTTSEANKAEVDEDELEKLLKEVVRCGQASENKENEDCNKEKTKRKYSGETNGNDFEFEEKKLNSSIRTNYQDNKNDDIGCFLNMEQVESPILEFEDFILF